MHHLILLAAETAETVDHGEDPFSPVEPVWSEMLWAAIFFIVLLIIISKVALPKLKATLAARDAELVGKLQSAENTRTEADAVLAEYRAKLAGAQGESAQIVEDARRAAEAIIAEAKTRAETEAAAITARAQAEVASERDRAMESLRATLADVSIQVASKVVGRSLDGDAQRQLVDTYIDELSSAARN